MATYKEYYKYRNMRYDDFIQLSEEELDEIRNILSQSASTMYTFVDKLDSMMIADPNFKNELKIELIESRFLEYIYRNPGTTASELGEKWDRTPAYMSRSLRRLEDLGLIYREIDPNNRIYLKIYVTEQGEEVVYKLKKYEVNLQKHLLNGILEEYSVEELEKFRQYSKTAIRAIKNAYKDEKTQD